MIRSLSLTLAESGSLSTVSLIIVLSLFVGIVAYVFIVPRSAWQKDANLPLDDSARPPRDDRARPSTSKENSRE